MAGCRRLKGNGQDAICLDRRPEARTCREWRANTCHNCGDMLTAVMPVENAPHWRHKAGGCDPWSEPEGLWHLGWKEHFDMSFREVALRDSATGEPHRADILVRSRTPPVTLTTLLMSPLAFASPNVSRFAHWMMVLHAGCSSNGSIPEISRLRSPPDWPCQIQVMPVSTHVVRKNEALELGTTVVLEMNRRNHYRRRPRSFFSTICLQYASLRSSEFPR